MGYHKLKYKGKEIDAILDRAMMTSFTRTGDYSTRLHYNTLDEEAIKRHFLAKRVSLRGGCTAVWNNGIIGRNYDWYYNRDLKHEVHVDNDGMGYQYAGVASMSDLDWNILPGFTQDGVNEHGLYCNPQQTMENICRLIPGMKNDDNVDEFWEGYISDSKLGKVPVYVPNLMDSSSKLLDEVMMNRILHEAIPELPSDIKKVIVYYVDITSEEEIYKFINEDKSVQKDFVELRDLKVVLDDVVAEDYAEYKVEQATEEMMGQTILLLLT